MPPRFADGKIITNGTDVSTESDLWKKKLGPSFLEEKRLQAEETKDLRVHSKAALGR